MDDTLSLGTEHGPWMIKSFSVVLREQITQAARRQGVTVAEWLHGYFVKHGIDGQGLEFAAVKFDPGLPNGGIDDLCKLTAAACQLAEHRDRMPKALSGTLARRLREALKAGEEPRGHQARLPAPTG